MNIEHTDLLDLDIIYEKLPWITTSNMVSEIHGAICAHVCLEGREKDISWLSKYLKVIYSQCVDEFNELEFEQSMQVCKELYNISTAQIKSDDFSFALLLPKDEESIMHRVKSLSFWCVGFSENLFLDLNIYNILSEEAKTSIEYIKKAQELVVDFEDSNVDIEETYYMEIMEYIRLAVIMIYLDARSIKSNLYKSETVH